MRSARLAAVMAALAASSTEARGEEARSEHALDAFLAADASVQPDGTGHGIAYLGWRWRAPLGRLRAELNTDTLTVTVDRWCLGVGLCGGAQVRGQLLFAGLLGDYFDRGVRVPEFGFSASYGAGALFAEARLASDWFVALRSTARRWFFEENADTEGFGLPPDTWVFEQRLNLTYWGFAGDPSLRDAFRPRWRLLGFGFGLQVEFHHRLDARPWGRGRGDEPLPRLPPLRNDPARNLGFVRQWAAFGVGLTSWLRLQLEERAGWGWREDDLTRARIGGMNPYAVPLSGAPWPAFLASRYLAGRASVAFGVSEGLETGPVVDIVTLQDILRLNDDAFGYAVGLGWFADVRWGAWQVELQAGYSPDVGGWQATTPHVTVYALLGRGFVL